MLCSDCNKNNAEIFINKIENGESSMEGLCRECAQKRGIEIPNMPPVNNKQEKQNNNEKNQKSKNKNSNNNGNIPPINNIDMSNMSKQLESLFKDLSANLKMENIEGLEDFDPEDFDAEDYENDEDGENNSGNPLGIPIGSIFASIVPKKQNQNEEESNGRQKVKVDKKKSKKKKK